MGNGQSRSQCGEAQWWVLLPEFTPVCQHLHCTRATWAQSHQFLQQVMQATLWKEGPRIPQHQPTRGWLGESHTKSAADGVPAPVWSQGCPNNGVDAAPAFSPPVVHTGWHPGTTGLWKNTMTCGLSDGDLTRHNCIVGSMASLPSDSSMFDPQIYT